MVRTKGEGAPSLAGSEPAGLPARKGREPFATAMHAGLIISGVCLILVAGMHALSGAEPTAGVLALVAAGGVGYGLAGRITAHVRHEFVVAGACVTMVAATHAGLGSAPTAVSLAVTGSAGALLGLGLAAVPRGRAASWLPKAAAAAGSSSWEPHRISISLAGCVLFSLGVKLFIDAGLGVDPLHSMAIGIERAVDHPLVGVGLASTAVTAAFLLAWSVWTGSLPPLATLATMALVGYLVDLWDLVDPEDRAATALGPTGAMLAGLLLEAYASALIIMSGIGIRVMDLVAVTMVRRWGWPFLAGKMSLELGFFATALLLGGPIGPGTVAFLCVVAPFAAWFMWANERLLGLPNHGLGPPSATAGT